MATKNKNKENCVDYKINDSGLKTAKIRAFNEGTKGKALKMQAPDTWPDPPKNRNQKNRNQKNNKC